MSGTHLTHKTYPHEAKNPELSLVVGPGVSRDDVLLAAYNVPELTPANFLNIVPHSSSSEWEEEIVMAIPDPGGFLVDENWNHNFSGLYGSVTGIFADDNTPLFYFHVCRYPVTSANYENVRVQVKSSANPQDIKYKIVFVAFGDERYHLYLYTSFGQETECTITYHGYKEQTGVSEIVEEKVLPLPVSIPHEAAIDNDEDFAGILVRTYSSDQYGTFKLQINDRLLPDPRKPVSFRYAVQAKVLYPDSTEEIFLSPWQTDTVLNIKSVTEYEQSQYTLDSKVLGTKSAREIMTDYMPSLPPECLVSYSAITDTSFVEVYCRPDGESPVYARTTADTGITPFVASRNVSMEGQRWRYVPYTDKIIEQVRIRMSPRTLQIVFAIEKDGVETEAIRYNIEAPYGFNTMEITRTLADLPHGDENSMLHVYIVNRPTGIDARLIVNDKEIIQPDGKLRVSWPEVETAGRIILRIAEAYQHGGFARVYAIKIVKKAPLFIHPPKKSVPGEWHLRVSIGRTELSDASGKKLVYHTGMPVVQQAIEKINPDHYGIAKLNNRSLAVSYNSNGQLVGIEPTSDGFTIRSCNPDNGIIRLDVKPGYKKSLAVRYWYVKWEQEYKGYSTDERFYPLDLNPRQGHKSGFEELGIVPSSVLCGTKIYLCLKPTASVDYYTEVQGESPVKASYVENDEYGKVLLLKTNYAIARNKPVRLYRSDTGTVIPFGEGETYWLYDHEVEDCIFIVNPDLETNPLGQPVARYLIDYWRPTTIPYITEYKERFIFHSLTKPENDEILVLGQIYVGPEQGIKDVQLVDARRRGGGVKEELLDKAYELEPQSRHYFDIGYWNGEPWQSYGSAVVFLPERVRNEKLSAERIQQGVDRHKVAGVLPIIKYWDAETKYPSGSAHLVYTLADDGAIGFKPPTHITATTVLNLPSS